MAAPIAPARFELPEDHPGSSDPAYRARRARIAEVGAAYHRGDPIPDVTYTAEEDEVWRVVSTELAVKHRRYACAEYLAGAERLRLPAARVPQLREVDERVHHLTGFHIDPVPGLVPTRTFYGSLAARTFLSTQYIRHHSVPFYTPEPDVIHEIIGHANMLVSPVFADLYQVAGQASLRATTDASLDAFSRVFWFTLEFGVVHEDGALKAYGAGLLSARSKRSGMRRSAHGTSARWSNRTTTSPSTNRCSSPPHRPIRCSPTSMSTSRPSAANPAQDEAQRRSSPAARERTV
jgi:phenylalanine-4-hydroxylase